MDNRHSTGRCRTGRHVISTTADIRPNGRCRKCSLENERAYRRRCREAYAAVRAAQLA